MGKSKNRSFYGEKLKQAARLIMYKRGRMPGAKEWELKTALGTNYEQVLDQLNEILEDLGFEVKKIVDDESPAHSDDEDSRYVVVLRDKPSTGQAKMLGWRIDNLAGLAISISYIISKQGKASVDEIEDLLAQKFGKWKAMALLEIYTRSAYINEDESGLLSIGWRTKAEVDLKELMKLVAEI